MITSNAPENYICPICIALRGEESEHTLMHQSEIFYKDDLVTGFINSFSLGGVTGNALVIPNAHYENIYKMSAEYGHRVFEVLQKTAIAMKLAYGCDGITTIQCNEPAGGQHAFHYHHHVMQRYDNDDFMTKMQDKKIANKEEKATCAVKLGDAWPGK